MGNYNDIIGGSGFSEPLTLDSKYYNKYTSSSIDEACNGSVCLSHGLSETAGWYGDYQDIFTELQTRIARDARYLEDKRAGIFAVGTGGSSGSENISTSFRLVMSPSL